MDRCRVGGKWTDHVATTSSGLFRKKPSFLVVLLVLLSFLALLPALSCGNDGQGDEREGDQVVSGFTDEMVRRLDEATAKRMQEDNLPSVVVGVWVPGEGRYVVVKGKANLKTGEKRDLGDPFRIGSITKTFVATAVLQLVEVGKLSKTDKLSEWYPDFPNAEKITIDDLLRMQSGIVDPPWEDLIGGLTSPQDAIEASANLGGASLPPGQRTEYRNINYVILGEIVGKVTGKDTGDQIARSILQPLGMNDTVYPADSTLPGDLRGYTLGYTLDPSTAELKDVTSFDPSAEGGSGAMISDASDLKIWAEAVCTGELLNDQMQKARLRTQRLLGQPNFVGYGEGIMQAGEFCGHSGSQPGFSSQMWYLPERDATIIVNVNREEEDITLSDALASAILEIVFPKYVEW